VSDVLKPGILRDTAVYWEREEVDEFGKPVYAGPIPIRCRWVDKSEQYLRKDGRTLVSKSVVYVDQDLVEGSVLFHGRVEDVPNELFDEPLQEGFGGWEIQAVSKLPNRKNTKFLRKVML
jgi:hypothetical protein